MDVGRLPRWVGRFGLDPFLVVTGEVNNKVWSKQGWRRYDRANVGLREGNCLYR